ncbi:hypothetical protein HPB51_019076 [Rhipicephalus microplus]|uniref:Uncharacterized protein n=1 Tax=Rhipicephalus microplus TaxID=6941 RepID=A0A9J6D6R4_RHIMP|nr:hypothetical protein HPB51_019076 [Rhipicephalus microplus]
MDQDELTHECPNVTPQDEVSASNVRPQRKTTLSTRAKEMYQTSREEHCRKLDSVWKNVKSALQALSRAKGEQFTGAKTHLRASYERYERATARYSAFLVKAKTFEARHELRLRQVIDEDREAIVSEKLREATPQERDKAHETASQFFLSVHSRTSRDHDDRAPPRLAWLLCRPARKQRPSKQELSLDVKRPQCA